MAGCLTDDERRALVRAGGAALRWNVPLGEDRAAALLGAVLVGAPTTVVDLGCGRAELLLDLLGRAPLARGVGVDTDGSLLARAGQRAVELGVADRVELVESEAASWHGRADAALCIGASHALGGTRAMFGHLASVVAAGRVVVGDGAFVAPPDRWCVDAFGELPDGLAGLRAAASAAGWAVVDADVSTDAEWGAFESGWRAGVLATGAPGAAAFVDERRRDYEDRYRGVVGFGWLVLER
jgi:SAM-dependent methyltransferase